MLTLAEVNSTEEFRSLKEDWNKLTGESGSKTIFLTWEWLFTWWETYSYRKLLNILCIYENDDNLVAIAPFYITWEKTLGVPIRILKLIGSEEVASEYLDIITIEDRNTEIFQIMINCPGQADCGGDVCCRNLHN